MQATSRWTRPTPTAVASLVAGLCWAALAAFFATQPPDSWTVLVVDDVGEVVVALAAAVLGCVAARRGRGRRRRAWLAIAGGAGAWAAGQAVWTWYEVVLRVEAPFPSLADLGYLAFPVGTLVGLLLLPRADSGLTRGRQLLDGVMVGAAVTAVSWTTALGAVMDAGGASVLEVVISLAYPVTDILLVTVALLVLARPSRERGTAALLVAGLTAMAVSDSWFVYQTSQQDFASGVPSLGWFGAFLLLAVAAVSASGRGAREADDPEPAGSQQVGDGAGAPVGSPEASGPSRYGLLLPYVPLVVVAASMAHRRLRGEHVDGPELLLVGIAVLLLLARQFLTVQENSRLWRAVDAREQQLRLQAFTDQLTGLANRPLFTERVAGALARQEVPSPVAVLFCDLDAFKAVNDSYGHALGDALLVQVAERLRAELPAGATLARLGGDEFAVLLEDGSDPRAVAARLVDALRMPFLLRGHEVRVSLSVGIALVDPGGPVPDLDALLAHADVAMYSAKRAGKARVAVHHAGMTLPESQDLRLRGPLAAALADGSVTAWLQPVVELDTGAVRGMEALARWTLDGRQVPPSQFVPVAARAGLQWALTARMLDEACRTAAGWARGGRRLWVSVNVSPAEITDPAFPARVAAVLRSTGLDPENLVLEVTEDGLLGNRDAAHLVTRKLKDLGVKLALDDFGTGYSSLAHLHEIPLDTLKIDRAFVSRVDSDPGMERMLAAVVGLAHQLGLEVVAEGIERPSEAEVLRRLGCRFGQGYLFGRPLPAADHPFRPALIG